MATKPVGTVPHGRQGWSILTRVAKRPSLRLTRPGLEGHGPSGDDWCCGRNQGPQRHRACPNLLYACCANCASMWTHAVRVAKRSAGGVKRGSEALDSSHQELDAQTCSFSVCFCGNMAVGIRVLFLRATGRIRPSAAASRPGEAAGRRPAARGRATPVHRPSAAGSRAGRG